MIVPKDGGAIKINYRNSNKLRTIIVDLDFLISYIEEGKFQCNGTDFPFDYNGADFQTLILKKKSTA